MKKVTSVEEGIKITLAMNEIADKGNWRIINTDDLVDVIEIDGRTYPFFWWREDSQLRIMKEMEQQIDSVSAKFDVINEAGQGLDKLMYRVFDEADWLIGSTIKKMMCFSNEKSMNILATYHNDKVVLFELGSTLASGTVNQGRRTVWGKQGMASDRVVSQKLASSAVYVFTDSNKAEEYNDEVMHLYGLEKDDVMRVSAAYKILAGETNIEECRETDIRIRKYIKLAKQSAQSGERIIVEEA